MQNLHELTIFLWKQFPGCMYLFKVKNKSTRAMYEKYSKYLLTIDNIPIWTSFLYIFSPTSPPPTPRPHLIQHFYDNISPMTHGINTKTNSWGRLQNNVTVSFISNPFICHTRLKFEIIAASCIKNISKKNMNDLQNKEHCCYKIHTSLTKNSAYPLLQTFYR